MHIKIAAIPDMRAGMKRLLELGTITQQEYDRANGRLSVMEKAQAKRTLSLMTRQNDRDLATNTITLEQWIANRFHLNVAKEALK